MQYSEYVPGNSDVFLIIELWIESNDTCQQCVNCFSQYVACGFDLKEKDNGFQLIIKVSAEVEVDDVMSFLNKILARHTDVEVVQTKITSVVQSGNQLGNFLLASHGNPSDSTIVLQTNQAFGTGTHPSTQLAVKAMEAICPFPDKVLDVGCGSGILAIVAARLGAQRVLGIDICPVSIDEARNNIDLNGLKHRVALSVCQVGDVKESFDLILANLTFSVFGVIIGQIVDLVYPNGRLIVSGLLGRQIVSAKEKMADIGWVEGNSWRQDKWHACEFIRILNQ